MDSRGRPYGQWPAQNPSDPAPGHFLPVAGTFTEPPPQPLRYPAPASTNPHIVPSNAHPYFSPQNIYHGSPAVPISNVEFEQAHASFDATAFEDPPLFRTNGPMEEEGFIPAPGHENDHVVGPDAFESARYGYETSSEEDFSDSEDERLAVEAALTHDREEDKDFSLSEDDLEENPEDFVIDDADPSDEEVPKRGKPKGRGSKGRGRPSTDAQGSSQIRSRRAQKPESKGRPKGRRVGPRPVADPGPEFRELQRLANEAYIKEDYETAMSFAKEAIKLNPDIFSAYSLLSEIHAAKGNEADSIGTLMGGAPTQRDKHLWYLILERIEKLDLSEYPTMTQATQDKLAVACLTSIIHLDSDDWEARNMKLAYEVRRQRHSSCVVLCRKMLQLKPHDTRILTTMARMGTANARQTNLHLNGILDIFESSIAYFLRVDRHHPSESALDFGFLYTYLDLLDKAGDYNYALSRLKTLSRWIQKRANETYWDDLDDDREFDFEDVRRITVPAFARQKKKRRGSYGKSLPLEIIVKMGIFRLRMDPLCFDEAMRHLNLLFPEDDSSEESLLWEDSKLFSIVARTLYETGHHEEALRFYEPLHKHNLLEHRLDTYIGLYTCYKNAGLTEQADTVISLLKTWELSTKDFRDWATMAKFFEEEGMMQEAMQRAEVVFENRASMLLRNNGFEHYDELRNHFFKQRKQARGKYGIRKARVKKYIKQLIAATRNELDPDLEQDDTGNNETSAGGSTDPADIDGELPPLPPLLSERPKKGLFRSRKSLVAKKPQIFMPIEEPRMLEGTNVPLEAIDHNIFRRKLQDLAENNAEEVKAAMLKQREISASFTRLEELSNGADDGDPTASAEYLTVARELIEEFSTFDIFYYDRRHGFRGYFRRLGSGEFWKDSALMVLAVQANRKEDGEDSIELKERPDTIPEDFHGIHFDKWVEVFCRYALLLAREGAEDRCFSALDVALQSNVFYKTQRYTCDIELCRLACALAVDDSQQASAAVRFLLKVYPFGTEIFRLYSAANRLCSTNTEFSTGAAYKVVLRWIKTIDYALLTPENRLWYNFKGADRTQWMSQTLVSGLIDQVKGHDPALFALFGHIMMCTGSYTTALNYFFRAFAITPEDPVLNLSIGVAYFQHALKRLAENRQYQIQQGIAFVTRYFDLRTKDQVAIHKQEAEYNVGRVYHGLGLMSQAVPYYRRCIALSDEVRREASKQQNGSTSMEDFAMEAAYALQTIYVLSGNLEGAFEVTLSALVIE